MTAIGACVKPRILPEIDCNLTKCNYNGGCGDSEGTTTGTTPGGGTGTITDPTGNPLTIPAVPPAVPGGPPVTLVFNPVTGQLEWVAKGTTLPDPTAPNQIFVSTGAGEAGANGAWTVPGGTAGQTLMVNAAGNIEWVTPQAYLINDEVTIALAANTPQTATATLLANIDSYKLINTANGQDVTESVDSILTSDTTIQLQSSVALTVKVEMIGPEA